MVCSFSFILHSFKLSFSVISSFVICKFGSFCFMCLLISTFVYFHDVSFLSLHTLPLITSICASPCCLSIPISPWFPFSHLQRNVGNDISSSPISGHKIKKLNKLYILKASWHTGWQILVLKILHSENIASP